jgi:hypothetical protein
MTMRIAKSFAPVWFLILLAGGIRGQALPRETMHYGAFGFPNPSGTRLLTDSNVPQPSTLRTALCSGGRRFSVRFERHQAEQSGHNGRRMRENFDTLAGDVFAVLQGKIESGASCFLTGDPLLSSAISLRAKPPTGPGECDQSDQRRLAASRSRPVVACRTIARLPADRRIVLVEFARQDRDALASVVLIDRHRTIFADYPAVFRGDGEDLWRVDDGGVLSAKEVQIVFLLQRGAFYALGVAWTGTEGASLVLFVSDGDNRFARAIEDY